MQDSGSAHPRADTRRRSHGGAPPPRCHSPPPPTTSSTPPPTTSSAEQHAPPPTTSSAEQHAPPPTTFSTEQHAPQAEPTFPVSSASTMAAPAPAGPCSGGSKSVLDGAFPFILIRCLEGSCSSADAAPWFHLKM
nr:leucine-rich repeat extensin-like protein 3 [Lolium perenne]